tara:strand:- start:3839 stop:4747 length:909 start_codon:yes stop_codon:yes gene_type:complete
MPYLRGKLKGQLKSAEIRKIVRLHNELSKVKIPPRLDREGLIKFIESQGFKIDHENMKIVNKNKMKETLTLKEAQEKFPVKPRKKKEVEKPEDKKEPLQIEDKVGIGLMGTAPAGKGKEFDIKVKNTQEIIEYINSKFNLDKQLNQSQIKKLDSLFKLEKENRNSVLSIRIDETMGDNFIDTEGLVYIRPYYAEKGKNKVPANKQFKFIKLKGELKKVEKPVKKKRNFKVEARERSKMIREAGIGNPYKILGIKASEETPELVKKKCRELRLKNHPDKGGDKDKFDSIQKACDILLSTQKKL